MKMGLFEMDKVGQALIRAMNRALMISGCEVRVTFSTKEELEEASRRLNIIANHEILPGAGNFLVDNKISTEYQIELLNGSCIVLLQEDR